MAAPTSTARGRSLVGALLAFSMVCGGCAGESADDSTATTAGSSASSAATTPTKPDAMTPNERCPGTNLSDAVRPTLIEWEGGYLYGLEAGAGSKVVVLVHGSGSRGACVWTNELSWMADAGLRVVAVDLPCVGHSTCPREPERPLTALTDVAASFAESDPSAKVAVVAASAGGPVAIHLASQPGSAIAATVALSPAGIESSLSENGTRVMTLDAAEGIRVPTLIATSPDDGAVDQQAIATLKATAPQQLASVELLPAGSGHAQEILNDATDPAKPSAFRARLVAFLSDHLS
jgi:pimeloyl-ACP methyl ester carboxylesterase